MGKTRKDKQEFMMQNPFYSRLNSTSSEPRSHITDPQNGKYCRGITSHSADKLKIKGIDTSGYAADSYAGSIANRPPSPPKATSKKDKNKVLPLSLNLSITISPHDYLILFRRNTAQYITEKVQAVTQNITYPIKINCNNGYPCVIIESPLVDQIPRSLHTQWSKLVQCVFVALTNQLSWSAHIPLEMLCRASFGQNQPSVAPCDSSIRINVGLIPKEYSDVIIQSIKTLFNVLNKDFMKLLQKAPISKKYLETLKTYWHKEWDQKKSDAPTSVWSWLWSAADRGNRAGITQIMRNHTNLEVIINKLYNIIRMWTNNTTTNREQLIKPLVLLPRYFYCKNPTANKPILSMAIPQSLLKSSTQDSRVGEVSSIHDHNFWVSANELACALDTNVNQFYKQKNIKGLYAFFETAFLQSICFKNIPDNFNAYSFRIPHIKSYQQYKQHGKTFFVSTVPGTSGMRVINLARLACEIDAGGHLALSNYDIRNTYFEVKSALQKTALTWVASRGHKKDSYKVLIYDLNHADTEHQGPTPFNKGPASLQIQQHQYQSIIIDHTSSTLSEIQEALAYASQYSNLVILVSSETKHSQGGNDYNAHGMMRICMTNKALLGTICSHIKTDHKPGHYKLSLKIRKRCERRGLALTTKQILSIK